MNHTVPRLAPLSALSAALLLSTPAGAWSPDDLATDSGVPSEISARWSTPSAPSSGKDWDKRYFRTELGEDRTIWCRHKECDEVLRGEDRKKSVALYYLSPAPPPPAAADAAGTTYWRAILSAYRIHWEPYKKGGLNEYITRSDTPLAIRPSRPFAKGDSWNLEAQALVLPPLRHEVVPANASLMVEAGDWPMCRGLDPAGYGANPGSIRKLHPMEIEIESAAGVHDDESDFNSILRDMARRADAGAYASARTVRGQAWAAAQKELDAKGPSTRFSAFEARFLYCRAKRYDNFQIFHAEMAKTKDPASFVAKWRQFVRAELKDYMKVVDGMPGTPKGAALKSPWDGYTGHDYQKELDASAHRTAAALEGGTRTLAKAPDTAGKPGEGDKVDDGMKSIWDKIK